MGLLRRVVFVLLLLIILFQPAFVFAQDETENWLELSTNYFVVLFEAGDDAVAQEYAGFVDEIYEEIETVFGHTTRTPLTLRLYPTLEGYYEVNPLARNVPGVVAHADFRRREVIVVLPQTEGLTPEGIQNNIRHELTHIVVSDLSGNRLNVGFQEGIAQYVEHPSPELDQKIQILRAMSDQGRLLPWSDFDDRDAIYTSPEVSYPQTLSVVAFLIEEYGFSTFREFLTMSSRSSGYRSALERTYEVAPADLETRWRDWLPSYLDGDYQRSALTSYDLAYPQDLMAQGNYAAAQTEIENAIERLQSSIDQLPEPDPQQLASLAEAQELLASSIQGQQAEQMAVEVQQALESGNYDQAEELINEVQALYAEVGDTRQTDVLNAYAERIERGREADAQLDVAAGLARTFQFPQARATAEAAAAEFAALGNASQLEEALTLRRSLDTYQRLAGLALVVVGFLGIAMSLFNQWYSKEREVW